jgi:hypothetical protein
VRQRRIIVIIEQETARSTEHVKLPTLFSIERGALDPPVFNTPWPVLGLRT